jgi:hypothetical protein
MASPQPSGNGETRTLADMEDTQGGLPLRPVRSAANSARFSGDLRNFKPTDKSADGDTNPEGMFP